MADAHSHTLRKLKFDNRFVQTLPGDPVRENFRRNVKNASYSLVNPTPVINPKLVAYSREMLEQLDLSEQVVDSETFLQVFSGNRTLPQMQPYAMRYGGHQFGHWAGQLGDGRAISLGDVITRNNQRWSLQLKGAGPTPYSRTADGLAVLRSSLREFLCSEAMFHLGVPTTRALSLVTTGESVVRDMFYDGHPQQEPGAVVCRVAPSFIRFGNFQIHAADQDLETLTKLVNYTIETDFPHLGKPSASVYQSWFEEVCRRTAEMIVHWMRVGFVHGVMNTDNMSILGLTIDYGPYGWLEDYDPDWTPNTTDAQGRRYRFGHQPQVAQWNLLQLANALVPLFDSTEPLEQALQTYTDVYQQQWQQMMAAKLGFTSYQPELTVMFDGLHQLLQAVETDMTIFYRCLSAFDLESAELSDEKHLLKLFASSWYRQDQIKQDYLSNLSDWLQAYQQSIIQHGVTHSIRVKTMNAANPKYVLRNYMAQEAIDRAEQGDFSHVNELLEVLRKPYDEKPQYEHFAQRRPEWARHRAGCSMLSCSS